MKFEKWSVVVVARVVVVVVVVARVVVVVVVVVGRRRSIVLQMKLLSNFGSFNGFLKLPKNLFGPL